MKRIVVLSLLCLVPFSGWAGGEQEAAASSARGKYLAGQGIIIPSEEVHIDSYIAHIDYQYPEPEEDLGVTLYSGHYQVSTAGQEEVIHVGIQGRKLVFENLPFEHRERHGTV